MRTFILAVFWLYVLGVTIQAVRLVGDHPRHEIRSVGYDNLALIEYLFIAAWAAYLLWGAA